MILKSLCASANDDDQMSSYAPSMEVDGRNVRIPGKPLAQTIEMAIQWFELAALISNRRFLYA